jgi:S1-C subfamily serine protease
MACRRQARFRRAAINTATGGPLIDADGHVIGAPPDPDGARPESGNVGIGFAIPSTGARHRRADHREQAQHALLD